jgi:hypothetical protein
MKGNEKPDRRCVIIPAQPGWFYCYYYQNSEADDEGFYLDPLIAWDVERYWVQYEGYNSVAKPICVGYRSDEWDDANPIKTPDGRFIFKDGEDFAAGYEEALDKAAKYYVKDCERRKKEEERKPMKFAT